MELKPGYKQTEVGVIPVEWDVAPLGRLVTSVEYGSAAKSCTRGLMPVLRMGNLQSGRIDWNDLVYTDDEQEIAKYALRPGDVLFNRTNTIDLVGKTSIYAGERPAIFAGYLIRVNVNKDKLDSRYLNYILNTELAKKYSLKVLSVAVSQANINGQKLKTYPVPLPPTTTEQSAIANALDDADALLAAQDALIAKKRAIKQGAMQELLTGKRRLPGFSGKWEVKRLGEIGVFLKGSGVRKDEANSGELPCVRYGEIYTQHDFYIKNFTSSISEEVASTAARIMRGDLLFAGSGETKEEIGKCVAFPDELEAYAGGDIVILRPRGTHPIFMGYACNQPVVQRQKSAKGQGDAVVHIGTSALASVEILMPGIEEQSAIAIVLSDMDTELITLQAERAKTALVMQGMIQALLTGRIRLV